MKSLIATAKHLVYGESDGKAAKSVLITNDRGTSKETTSFLASRSQGLDLAFVVVSAPATAAWNPSYSAPASLSIGAETWLFGVEGRFELRPIAARVRAISASAILMDGIEGRPGSSGGPVFSSEGLVGLYLGLEGASSGQAIPIERIKREAEAAGIRWDVLPSGWILRRVAVSLTRRDNFPVEVAALFVRTQEEFKVPGRYQAYAGDYALKFDIKSVRCEPQVFVISPVDNEKSITVTCEPYLVGTYENRRFMMTLTDLDNSSYEILVVVKTLPDTVVGFSGRLIQSSNDRLLYDLTGTGMQGLVSGSVRFSADLRTASVAASIGNQKISEGLKR